MTELKKIQLAADFTGPWIRAVQAARKISNNFKSDVIALHVLEPIPVLPSPTGPSKTQKIKDHESNTEDEALKNLNRILDNEFPSTTRVLASVCRGTPEIEIAKSARENGADLIILALHNGKRSNFNISLAEKLLNESDIPLLITKETQ